MDGAEEQTGGSLARHSNDIVARRAVYIGAVALVAAVGLASVVAIAQKQDAAPAPAETPTAASVAAPAPQRVETIAHGAWNVTCQYFADPAVKTRCAGVLRVTESKSQQVVFAFVLAKNAEGQLVASFQTPTGILVQKGVELKFGAGTARRVPYVSCEPQHCDASAVFDAALTKEAAASATSEATIYGKDGRSVIIKMNQTGIDKVLEALGG